MDTNGEMGSLPQLQVDNVELTVAGELVITGRVGHNRNRLKPGDWFYLWTAPRRVVLPFVSDLDLSNGEVRIRIDATELLDEIQIGMSLPWLDGYWSPKHVSMVLDGVWEYRTFEPEDALHFDQDGVRGWTRANQPLPEGATQTGVESGGWDHEHCEICRVSIGQAVPGYVDQDDNWMCPECYERWVKTRDLGFVLA